MLMLRNCCVLDVYVHGTQKISQTLSSRYLSGTHMTRNLIVSLMFTWHTSYGTRIYCVIDVYMGHIFIVYSMYTWHTTYVTHSYCVLNVYMTHGICHHIYCILVVYMARTRSRRSAIEI